MTVDEIVRGIAQDVADLELGYEFQTFPQDQILRLVNEARCVVYALTPDKYAQVTKVLLQPCKQIQESGCDTIIKVLDQVDAAGCHIADILEPSVSKFRITWNKKSNCSTDAEYKVGKAWTVTGINGSFMVDPPPPANTTIYVNVLCASKPSDLLDTDDLGCEETAWIFHYVIFRLLSTDTESVGHKSVADTYYKSFLNLLGLADKAENDFKIRASINAGVNKR